MPPVVVVEGTKPAAAKKATKKTTKNTAPPSTPTQATPTAATLGVPGATGIIFPLAAETKALDDAGDNLLTRISTNSYSMNREVPNSHIPRARCRGRRLLQDRARSARRWTV